MRRASYRAAVAWIAENDEAGDDTVEIAEMISTLLVADIFGVTPERVASDVVRYRRRAA